MSKRYRNSSESSSSSSEEKKSKKKSKQEVKEDVKKLHESSTGRTGGVYIPPFKMRLIEKSIKDKVSQEYQRVTWDALKKSLNGIVNKVSQKNIAKIIPEIFSENLIRGKGPLCQSLVKAQAAAIGFSNVYACLVAVVNTKLPEIGELLSKRLISSWTKAYQRNQKASLIATSVFIAHLVNQYVIGSLIPLQILALLLDKPTDDGVEVAVNFIKECGQRLSKMSPKPFNGIFNVFRSILHEGTLDKRVQYMIEHLFIIRKSNFSEHEAVVEALDLIEVGDQITHDYLTLDDEYDGDDLGETLNIFQYDPNFEESERQYEAIRKEILGDSDEEDSSDEEEAEEDEAGMRIETQSTSNIVDKTGADIVSFKRTVFLTVMSSLDFEECVHKLLKQGVPENYELDLCRMLIDCCAQERSYRRFYGLLCQRFCQLKQNYRTHFQELCFAEQYENCHVLETNRLRHVALLFSHLLYSDAIAWSCLRVLRLNVDETNPSKRIFIKTIFKDLSEFLGAKLNQRLQDPDMQEYYVHLLPKDDPEKTRFSINFFTSIGLGPLTVDMRNHLKMLKEKKSVSLLPSSSSESTSSSTTSSDDSDSDSSDSDSSSSDSEDSRDKRRRNRPIKLSSSSSSSSRTTTSSNKGGNNNSRNYNDSKSIVSVKQEKTTNDDKDNRDKRDNTRDNRDTRESRDNRDSRDTRESRDNRDNRESRENRDNRESRENRDKRDNRDRDTRDNRDNRERDNRDNRDNRERDNRDNRERENNKDRDYRDNRSNRDRENRDNRERENRDNRDRDYRSSRDDTRGSVVIKQEK